MPVIFVYGVSEKHANPNWQVGPEGLSGLRQNIKKQVSSIAELRLTEERITVFFPTDVLQEGLGEEIIIIVKGLDRHPDRTWRVRDHMAEVLVECCEKCFVSTLESPKLIECIIDWPSVGDTCVAKRYSGFPFQKE